MSWWTDLLEQDKDLKSQLNAENKTYYKKMENYIRYGTQLKDNPETKNLLREILRTLISTQEKGVPIEEHFGGNPKAFADEKIATLNSRYRGIIEFIAAFIIVRFLFQFALNDLDINISNLILTSSGAIFWWIAFFKFAQWEVYSKVNSTIRSSMYMATTASLFILGFIIGDRLDTVTGKVQLPFIPMSIILLGVNLVLTLLFLINNRKKKLNWMFYMIFLWGAWIIGILNYL